MAHDNPAVHRVKISFLKPGQSRSVRIDGLSILVCNADGEFFAVQETCTHRALSMARGRIKDATITCPHHGACFSLRDGSLQYGSGKAPLRTFAVKAGNGFVDITVTPEPAPAASDASSADPQ